MSVLGTVTFKSDANIRDYDYGQMLAHNRLREMYTIGSYQNIGYLHGRIEFLEKVIKDNLGEDFWNEHCKELD